MSINILDSMIINRISAGEVVESPFSIVKELIDNSLDAGATKITISIKNGGTNQIIVKDNGKGIEKDDIVKAFLPHATSKIKDIEDLNSITTLGFRGEALASISNVSQVQIQTKTKDADCGYQLEVNGGVFGEVSATSMETGTKIEVNNLFYNTPARLKFMKKPKQEESAITNIVSRYILAHPTIEFRYEADGEIVYQTKGKTLLDAICCVYSNDMEQNIMPIDKTIGNLHVFGYVSKVGFSKPNTTYQTLILNSRYVIDETVSKASYMAFEEYLMTRQFPFFVINLDMPPVDVDVNVHPSKLNVKFSSPSKVYDLVYTAIREQIYKQLNPETQVISKQFMGDSSA
ncbi:MAG: DNA mismatch repair endonuclease MutL, partial [Clostridia bacterium]|nr:DNA mismatch repair endonuclease MutL [Clostridia bacterium]